MVERRHSPRIIAVQNVTYTVTQSTPRLARAFSKDISEDGVCLLGKERLDQDTQLGLDITISDPTTKLIRVEGRVAWQAPWPVSSKTSSDSEHGGIDR